VALTRGQPAEFSPVAGLRGDSTRNSASGLPGHKVSWAMLDNTGPKSSPATPKEMKGEYRMPSLDERTGGCERCALLFSSVFEGREIRKIWSDGKKHCSTAYLWAWRSAKKTIDSRCGIFWCQIRASDGVLLQEGLVEASDHDYLVPSLAVDAKGNIGLGCTRTSATECPSVCVMVHGAGDPKNTMRAPVVAAKGTTVFQSKRPSKFGLAWGNYNTTCLDPTDPNIF